MRKSAVLKHSQYCTYRKRRHTHIPNPQAVLTDHKDRGFCLDNKVRLKCEYDNKPKGSIDNSKIKAQLKSDNHTIYEMTRYVKRQAQQRLIDVLSNASSKLF
jgi:hypothetical protein